MLKSEKVAKYLNIPHKRVQRAFGEQTDYTQDDKIAFTNNRGNGIISTTINRKAEIKWLLHKRYSVI